MNDAGAPPELCIRPLRPADAEALVRCFERCYGRSYVDPGFYDPAELRSRLSEGRLRSVGAIDGAGEVVAHMALVSCHPDARTVEAGHTVVDPGHRKQQLAGRVAARLAALCVEAGFVAFHHYPTTAHRIMQKLSTSGSGVETGIMLRYIPGETDYGALAGTARGRRWAATVVFQPLAPLPAREICLPARYAALLRQLYARAGAQRRERHTAASLPAGPTRVAADRSRARSLLRVRVQSLGADLVACIERLQRDHRAELVQLDLPLGEAGVAAAVEGARSLGFFYCALLPEYGPGDVLRLQKLPGSTGAPEAPDLETAEARALFEWMRSDHADATGKSGSIR